MAAPPGHGPRTKWRVDGSCRWRSAGPRRRSSGRHGVRHVQVGRRRRSMDICRRGSDGGPDRRARRGSDRSQGRLFERVRARRLQDLERRTELGPSWRLHHRPSALAGRHPHRAEHRLRWYGHWHWHEHRRDLQKRRRWRHVGHRLRPTSPCFQSLRLSSTRSRPPPSNPRGAASSKARTRAPPGVICVSRTATTPLSRRLPSTRFRPARSILAASRLPPLLS